MLQFDGNWRFDSPGPIESAVQEAFRDLINRICGQGQRKAILEHFKARFCAAGGAEYWLAPMSGLPRRISTET